MWRSLSIVRQSSVSLPSHSGINVALRSLLYLDEQGDPAVSPFENKFKTRCSEFDKREFTAYSAVVSTDGRYVAFIGEVDNDHSDIGIFVLDTDKDRINLIGKPPAPPPDADPLACKDEYYREWNWEWGAPERHYTLLPPEIFSFIDNQKLRVSYGEDTPLRRAKKRVTEVYDLGKPYPRPMVDSRFDERALGKWLVTGK